MSASTINAHSDASATPLAAASRVSSARITGTPHMWDSYALRYQVYCQQLGILSAEHYPSGFEQDHFDDHAEHVGVYRGNFWEMVGTVRLVLGTKGTLPIVKHCPYPVGVKDPGTDDIKVAEISRLAISKSGLGTIDRVDVVRSLYRGLYQVGTQHGITHALAAMEKTLARLLMRRFDLEWEPIGPEFDYAGPVRPYALNIESIARTSPDIARRIPNRCYRSAAPVRTLHC